MIKFPMVKVAFDENVTDTTFKAKVEVGDTTFKEGMKTDEKLHALYAVIGCNMVEVAYIEVNGKEYTVFFDEEGKLGKWVPTLPLYNQDGKIYDVTDPDAALSQTGRPLEIGDSPGELMEILRKGL